MMRIPYACALGMSMGIAGCVLFHSNDALTHAYGEASPFADGGGGEDGPPAVEGGGTERWCATNAKPGDLCDDFDRESLAEGWETNTTRGTSVTLDTDPTHARSAPRSLATSVAAGQADCAYARVQRDVPVVRSRTEIATDVSLGPAGTTVGVAEDVVVLAFVIGETNACQFLVRFGPTNVALLEQVQGSAPDPDTTVTPTTTKAPAGVWTRVKLTVDLATRTVDLDVGGAAVLGGPRPLAYNCKLEVPGALAVGIHCHPSGPKVDVRYDNVVLTTR